MRINQLLAPLLCLALLQACATSPQPAALQTHASAHLTDQPLYTLPETGSGQLQSPLNLLTATTSSQHHDIYLEGAAEHVISGIKDTGHSIQIDFSQPEHVHFDDSDHELQQCHFHTPSEHQIDGITYPMEMHCVSQDTRSPAGATPHYLVIAYLFRMGASNAGVATVSQLASAMRARDQTSADISAQALTLEQIIGSADNFEHYFNYAGSLTTAPYSETVRWLVLTRILTASPEQIRSMNQLDGNNARHIQADNRRPIELD